jgi:ParB-like chromosome segregation protein Spo0J
MADAEIAKEIGRSLTSVKCKRLKLGIAPETRKNAAGAKAENAGHLWLLQSDAVSRSVAIPSVQPTTTANL